MKNKILLINTLNDFNYWQYNEKPTAIGFPNGILSIGTILLKKGYDVKIINPVVDKNYLTIIEREAPGCLWYGISTMTSGIKCALHISRKLKRISPVTPIVWGGVHPTLFPEETIDNENVDIVCFGEGENTAVDLSEALRNNDDIKNVKGIYYKLNDEVIFTGFQKLVDLNTFPSINYNLLDINKYLIRDMESLGVGKGLKKVFVLNTGRGCPYKCTFCWNTHPSQKFRYKSFEKIKQELDFIVKKYHPEVIHIQDDIFFCNKNRVLKFLDFYDDQNYTFKWFALSRANYFNEQYLNLDFLKRLKKSCIFIGVGVESGSKQIREELKKEVTEEQILYSAKVLAEVGIPAGYAFMIALPIEEEKDWFKTLKLIFKLKTIHHNAECGLQYFRPYPGSKLYNIAVEKGYIPPKTLEEWADHTDFDTGYSHVRALPWVKKPQLVEYLTLAAYFGCVSLKKLSFIKKIAAIFMKCSLMLRIKFNFSDFVIEYYIINFFRKFKKKLVKLNSLIKCLVDTNE